MSSRSRDALVSFAAGALLALVVVRIVPAVLQRVACSAGACTTTVASARTPRLARDTAIRRERLARNDTRGAQSGGRDLGPGVYVMRAPEPTAPPAATSDAVAAPSPPSDAALAAPAAAGSDAAVAAPSPDAAMLLAEGSAPGPATAPGTAADAAATSPDTTPRAAASPPPQLDVASNTVETTLPAAAPPRGDASAATAPLDGWWLVTNAIESDRPRPYEGFLIVYRIELRQDGEHVFGKGSTWSRNGRVLTPSQRTPVVATGTWRDNRVELVLIEHARRGARRGRIEWHPTADGEAFEGRFSVEATNMIGRSEAIRELSAPMDEARAQPRRPRRHARLRTR